MARRLVTDTCIVDDSDDYLQFDSTPESTPPTSPDTTPIIKRKQLKKNVHELQINGVKFHKQRYHKVAYLVGGDSIFKGTVINSEGVKTKITIRDPTVIKFTSLDNDSKVAKQVKQEDVFLVQELIEGRNKERAARKKKLQRRNAFYCSEQLEPSPESTVDLRPRKIQKLN